ncbi:MAG: hypothetical protein V4471_03860 [Pseudomonadota bacterium]
MSEKEKLNANAFYSSGHPIDGVNFDDITNKDNNTGGQGNKFDKIKKLINEIATKGIIGQTIKKALDKHLDEMEKPQIEIDKALKELEDDLWKLNKNNKVF